MLGCRAHSRQAAGGPRPPARRTQPVQQRPRACEGPCAAMLTTAKGKPRLSQCWCVQSETAYVLSKRKLWLGLLPLHQQAGQQAGHMTSTGVVERGRDRRRGAAHAMLLSGTRATVAKSRTQQHVPACACKAGHRHPNMHPAADARKTDPVPSENSQPGVRKPPKKPFLTLT